MNHNRRFRALVEHLGLSERQQEAEDRARMLLLQDYLYGCGENGDYGVLDSDGRLRPDLLPQEREIAEEILALLAIGRERARQAKPEP
jgi:hypothetical protein